MGSESIKNKYGYYLIDSDHIYFMGLIIVSDVMHGKIGKFTIDDLVNMVELTGHHVK